MVDLLVPPKGLAVPPAHVWIPPQATSVAAANDAIEFMGELGFTLDPEQQLGLHVLLAERDDHRWATLEAAIVAARQNLKTFLFKAIALYELFVVKSRLVVWTAHEFDTAMEAFRDLFEIIDQTEWLRSKVKLTHRGEVGTAGNTKVGIEFLNGQRIRFKARTNTGGRGLTGDVVFLDEAFALQPSHVGSLLPTMAAKSMHGNPRIYYGSSAGQVNSGVLRNLRDRGRGGGDPALVYVEWCAPEGGCALENCPHSFGTEGCVADDIEMVRLANPALERRISIEFVETMRRSLPPDEFVREFLGWFDEPAAGMVGIPIDKWDALADREAVPTEPCAMAIDVAPGALSGAITTCSGTLDVAEHEFGTSWIVPSLKKYVGAHNVMGVGIDPSSPAGALIPDLEREGFTIRTKENPTGLIVPIMPGEASRACESFLAAVLSSELTHRDQMALNQAVEHAGRRLSGDTWRWSRLNSTVDITPLTSATWARWLYIQAQKTAPAAGASKQASEKSKKNDGGVFRPKERLKL